MFYSAVDPLEVGGMLPLCITEATHMFLQVGFGEKNAGTVGAFVDAVAVMFLSHSFYLSVNLGMVFRASLNLIPEKQVPT